MKNKSIIYIVLGSAFISLIPLIAMRYTDEVMWTISDFVFVWILLVIIGISFKLMMTNKDKRKIIYFILIIPFGIFLFIFGELDDSPGGQILGLILTIIATIGIIKNKRKTKLNKID